MGDSCLGGLKLSPILWQALKKKSRRVLGVNLPFENQILDQNA